MTCSSARAHLLPLLAAACLLVPVESCMVTALQHARMPASRLLANETVKSGGGGCRCCQLCRRHPACGSFSVNTAEGRCELYDQVGSYFSVAYDPTLRWRYRVMPGRSGPGGFCRRDSDCRQRGERCRGRVCTTLAAVTCNDIYQTLGVASWNASDFELNMFGWLHGREMPLLCVMTEQHGGLTLLLISTRRQPLDQRTLMHKEAKKADLARFTSWLARGGSYSLLLRARDIRNASAAASYQVFVSGRTTSGGFFMARMSVPRDEPLLAAAPRPDVGNITLLTNPFSAELPALTLPYLPDSGPVLLTVNCDDPTSSDGALVHRDGANITWAGAEMAMLAMSIQ